MNCSSCGQQITGDTRCCQACGIVLPPSPQYAGFGERVGAFIIDRGMALILLISLIAIVYLSAGAAGREEPSDLAVLLVVLAFLLLPPSAFGLFESSSWQASPGKRLLKLQVTDMNGRRPSFIRAFGRQLAKYLSGIYGIGYIMAACTAKKQGLHDLIAVTLVIKRGEEAQPVTGSSETV